MGHFVVKKQVLSMKVKEKKSYYNMNFIPTTLKAINQKYLPHPCEQTK